MHGLSTRASEAPAVAPLKAAPARREGAIRRIGRNLVAAAQNRRAVATLRRGLGREWRVLDQHCLFAATGECLVDHILLHPDSGVMLVLVDRGIYAAPDIAIEVMRSVLRQVGFGNRFHGHLPVNCVSVERAQVPGLPAQLKDACADAAPVEIAEPDWIEWLQQALRPYRLAAAERASPWHAAAADMDASPVARGGAASLAGFGLRDAIVATATILVFGSGVAVGAMMLGKPREPAAAPLVATAGVSYVIPASLPLGAEAAEADAAMPPLPRAKPIVPAKQ
jgi:hypothetical protein